MITKYYWCNPSTLQSHKGNCVKMLRQSGLLFFFFFGKISGLVMRGGGEFNRMRWLCYCIRTLDQQTYLLLTIFHMLLIMVTTNITANIFMSLFIFFLFWFSFLLLLIVFLFSWLVWLMLNLLTLFIYTSSFVVFVNIGRRICWSNRF